MILKNVGVIGCGGFVGSHVVATLLDRGYQVRGTLRDVSAERTAWLPGEVGKRAPGKLTLVAAEAFDIQSIREAMSGMDGVIICAGSPVVEPANIDLMAAIAQNTTQSALELGIPKLVFTSSTGSTNPPSGEPALKNEEEHWSDDSLQLEQKKYAAVGKTRLDRTVLQAMNNSNGALKTVTINPSMITGPCFQPDPVTSLKSFAAILRGERFGDRIPNSSMSMIDVRDLANLHVRALELDHAQGRYFGVKKSWHWRDILCALSDVVPEYQMPIVDPNETAVVATAFDLQRQDTLGVKVRDLPQILESVVRELRRRNMI